MNILIIGGSGNLSSAVVERLVEAGERVTTLTRGKGLLPVGVTALVADRNDEAAFKRALGDESYDCVVNFLGLEPRQCEIDYRILRGRVGQYLYISSATVYQKPPSLLPITEQTPLSNPYSVYAQNKIACEEFLMSVHGSNFPVTIVRPTHTFGNTWIPNQLNGSSDFTVASRILKSKPIVVADKGETQWTLTTVRDFARGLAGLMGNGLAIGEAVHITSEETLTWNEIYQVLGQALGVPPRIQYIPAEFLTSHFPTTIARLWGDKGYSTTFDNSKLRTLIPGFSCTDQVKEALADSVAWYLADQRRQQVNHEQEMAIEEWIAAWTGSPESDLTR